MHAASVHPEPGSNSLKKLYIKLYSESAGFRTDFMQSLIPFTTFSRLIPFFQSSLMFALYFEFTFWFVFQKNCRDFVIIFLSFNFLSFLWKPHCFVLNLSLAVQFSRTISLPLAWVPLLRDLNIISYSLPFVKGFCKSFFDFFHSFFCSRLTRPLYYIIFFRVCQEVFEKFFEVFSLHAFRCSLAHSFNIISYPSPFVKGFSKKNWKNLKFFSKYPVWLHSFKFYCIDKSTITWYNSNNRASFGSESGES